MVTEQNSNREALQESLLHQIDGLTTVSRKMGYMALISIFILASFCFVPGHGNPDAKRLYDDLMSNYNSLVLPVANTTELLTIKMDLKLSQLIDVVSIQFV